MIDHMTCITHRLFSIIRRESLAAGQRLQDGEIGEWNKTSLSVQTTDDPGLVYLSLQTNHCSSWEAQLITVLGSILVQGLGSERERHGNGEERDVELEVRELH